MLDQILNIVEKKVFLIFFNLILMSETKSCIISQKNRNNRTNPNHVRVL